MGEELFPPGNSPARDLFFFHEELFSALGTPGRAGFNPLPCCRSEFKEFPAAGKAGKAAGLKVGEPREVPAVGIPGCCSRTPWNCRNSTTPEPSNSAANNSHLHPPGAPPEKKSIPAPNPIFFFWEARPLGPVQPPLGFREELRREGRLLGGVCGLKAAKFGRKLQLLAAPSAACGRIFPAGKEELDAAGRG